MRPIVVDRDALDWYVDPGLEPVTIEYDYARRREIMTWLEEHAPNAVVSSYVSPDLETIRNLVLAGAMSMSALSQAQMSTKHLIDVYIPDATQAVAFKLTFG